MQRYVMGVIVVNDTGDKSFILQERKNSPSAGLLSAITGKVEKHERAKAALVREVKEETRLDTKQADWRQIGMFTGSEHDTRIPHDDWSMEIYLLELDAYAEAETLGPILAKYPLSDATGEIDILNLGRNSIDFLPEYYDEMDRLTFLVISAYLAQDMRGTMLTLDL